MNPCEDRTSIPASGSKPFLPATLRVLMALALVGASGSSAFGGIIWNESVNGQLSSNPAAPTPLAFLPGSNEVIGESHGPTGANLLSADADIFTFTVPTGYRLSAINIFAFTNTPSNPTPRHLSFAAIQAGNQITSTTNGSALLGSTLFGTGSSSPVYPNLGGDLLPALGSPPTLLQGTGFNGPLGPGTYTFWVQEGNGSVRYDLAFQITPVPEPSSFALLAVGLAGADLCRRWLRKRRGRLSSGPLRDPASMLREKM